MYGVKWPFNKSISLNLCTKKTNASGNRKINQGFLLFLVFNYFNSQWCASSVDHAKYSTQFSSRAFFVVVVVAWICIEWGVTRLDKWFDKTKHSTSQWRRNADAQEFKARISVGVCVCVCVWWALFLYEKLIIFPCFDQCIERKYCVFVASHERYA